MSPPQRLELIRGFVLSIMYTFSDVHSLVWGAIPGEIKFYKKMYGPPSPQEKHRHQPNRRDRKQRQMNRRLCAQLPAHCILIKLTCGAVAGGEPSHFEPRMVLQKLYEALTDNSGRAQDANGDLSLCHGMN